MNMNAIRRRRQGYTIIELLVAMALIMTIMAILSEAFVAGLDTFSRLKAIGDLSEKLRMATSIMRRDLAADHFNGSIRVSDASFSTQPPTSGFVRISQGGISTDEGSVDGIHSYRAINHILHMSVKLRGNRQEDFFAANFPTDPAGLMTKQTTFFNQPADARYQSTVYTSQWGEVAYYLQPINNASAGTSQLYALYRAQRVVLADNTAANSSNTAIANPDPYAQMSYTASGGNYRFNCPSDLTTPTNRAISLTNLTPTGAGGVLTMTDTLLLSDVLSFDIRALPNPLPAGAAAGTTSIVQAFHDVNWDSGNMGAAQVDGAGATVNGIWAVQITIRVWDLKTRQTRQVTFTQDM